MSSEQLPASGEITRILWALRDGEAEALSRLMYVVYPSLRRLAADLIRNERPGHTLGPTELVHEMLLSMLLDRDAHFENRRHFFACTARKMRQLLIDHARKRQAVRNGGTYRRTDLSEVDVFLATEQDVSAILAMNDLIEKLAATDPRAAEVLDLRYVWGFTSAEVAEMVGVNERTVDRDWQFARKWLARQLRGADAAAAGQG
jgi:RNA polymerase sigma factor (TIGR02999 family)